MARMNRQIALIFALSSAVLAAGALRFVPEVYPLGEVKQGEVKHVILKGSNTGDAEIVLETVMSQGTSSSNFKHPKTIKPGEVFQVEFDVNTQYMEGEVAETIVLVDTSGKAFTAAVQGTVTPELMFSEKLLDAGYYSKGEKREWTFYVWSPEGKARPELKLTKDAARDFKAKFQNVSLNVDKLDEVREGGSVPGLKVTLSTSGIVREGAKGQKSLRRLVGFESKANPKAKPEVLIIGYWK